MVIAVLETFLLQSTNQLDIAVYTKLMERYLFDFVRIKFLYE